MKKKLLIILSIIIFTVVLSVQASQTDKILEIFYNNIKVKINGEEFTPKTEGGDVIEPFIYNGTTYLPVRGIAKAFNLDVTWIPEKTTILLEKAKTQYLDDLSFVSYDRDSGQSYMAKNKTEKSEHGLKFYFETKNIGQNNGDTQIKSTQKVIYNVPAGSKTLNLDVSKVKGNASIKIKGKDKVLYDSPVLSGDSDNWSNCDNINVKIDISEQEQIMFEIELQGHYRSEWETSSGIQFENARFER